MAKLEAGITTPVGSCIRKRGRGGESGRMRREERWLLPRLRVDPGRAVAGRRVFAVFSLVTRAARRSAAEITA